MTYVPSTEEYQKYLQGQSSPGTTAPTLSGGVVTGSPTSSSERSGSTPGPVATPSFTAAPTIGAPAPTAQAPGVGYSQQGQLGSRLFDPLSGGLEKQRTGTEAAGRVFYEAAGPSRTYASSGAESTLSRALGTGFGEDVAQAKPFVTAQYGGPGGLSAEEVGRLQQQQQGLRTRQEALRSGSGLQTVIGQSVGGLTAGQKRFEAKRLLGDEGYRSQVAAFQPQLREAASALEQQRRGAIEFAQQRTGEEADIQARSRGYLTGRRGEVTSALDLGVQQREGERAQAAQAWGGFMGDESEANLATALGAVGGGPFEAGDFATRNRAMVAQAKQEYQQILEDPRWGDIANVGELGLGGLGITERGREDYVVRDPETGENVLFSELQKRGNVAPEVMGMWKERQAEIERKFGTPHGGKFTQRRLGGEAGDQAFRKAGIAGIRPEGGEEYLSVAELPRVSDFMTFDPGKKATRANISSAEQRRVFNTVNKILDQVDRLDDVDPYRAASIAGELDEYLKSEEAAIEQHKGKLDAGVKSWTRRVKKTRKTFEKMKKKKAWGKVAKYVGGVATGGLSDATEWLVGTNPAETEGYAAFDLSQGDYMDALRSASSAKVAAFGAPMVAAGGVVNPLGALEGSPERLQRDLMADYVKKTRKVPPTVKPVVGQSY